MKMKQNMPPDWESGKLWDVLGKVAENKPPTNFLYSIRRKLEDKTFVPSKALFSPFFYMSRLVRNLGLAAAASCVILSLVWMDSINSKNKAIETVQLAQNFDLIKDFDVIANLDEL